MKNTTKNDTEGLLRGLFEGANLEGAQIIAYNAGEVNYTKQMGKNQRKSPDKEEACKELFTPEAMALWKKLQDKGYVDENYMCLIPQKRISIIALVMAETLGLNPIWRPFETLGWFAEGTGSTICSNARNYTEYGEDLYNEIKILLK